MWAIDRQLTVELKSFLLKFINNFHFNMQALLRKASDKVLQRIHHQRNPFKPPMAIHNDHRNNFKKWKYQLRI